MIDRGRRSAAAMGKWMRHFPRLGVELVLLLFCFVPFSTASSR
jgi:hypothetical protein